MSRLTPDILREIIRERQAQDEQWGGPDHDDNHEVAMWMGLILKFQGRAAAAIFDQDMDGWRRAMLQSASLIVAAIESHDRVLAEVSDVTAEGSVSA